MTLITLHLGPVPAEETCAQLGRTRAFDRYARLEAHVHRAALIARFGPPPRGASLRAEGQSHDFGRYYDLVARYDADDPAARAWAAAIDLGLARWLDAGFLAPVLYNAASQVREEARQREETHAMTYDVAYRHAQALDPSALTTVTTTFHAIDRAIEDCRRAGGDPEHDAAIRLLSLHLGAVAQGDQADASALRRECTAAIVAIRRRGVLPTLAAHGVDDDADAKRLFHAEGRRALGRLGRALALTSDSYEVRSNHGGSAVSGEVTLHGEAVWVQLSLGLSRGRELLFRRVRGRGDHAGGRNHWASIDELMAPERLAARIAATLGLEPAARSAANAPELLLFARAGAIA